MIYCLRKNMEWGIADPVTEDRFKIERRTEGKCTSSWRSNVVQAIFSVVVAARHKLRRETEMREVFQTSLMALREALRDPEQEGTITIERGFGGGAFVTDFDNRLQALFPSTEYGRETRAGKECRREPGALLLPVKRSKETRSGVVTYHRRMFQRMRSRDAA